MISWQTAAHWPYVEAPFPFYLVFYDRGLMSRIAAYSNYSHPAR